jgi:hypothetical protein
MENPKPLASEFQMGITAGIILSLVTCGIYNIYWNYRQFKALNYLLGREEYRFAQWLLLSIITCGIYHVYYEYKMGSDLLRYFKQTGTEINENLALIGLVLSCLGLTVIADAIYQHELNRLCA